MLLGCCHAITLPPTPLLALRGGVSDRKALVLKGSGLPPLDKVVDACLAGLGLAGSCALLGVMEPRFGVKLFVPPMMASGILFFSPVKPPSPKGILSGTVGCASVSAVVFSLLSGAVSPAAASGAAAGALLMWYKATECIFPPAAVVCVLMAGQAGQASGLKALASPAGLNWLATTWLGGHACMYAGAMGTAVVRGKARQVLARRKLRQMGNLSRVEVNGDHKPVTKPSPIEPLHPSPRTLILAQTMTLPLTRCSRSSTSSTRPRTARLMRSSSGVCMACACTVLTRIDTVHAWHMHGSLDALALRP